MAEKCLFVNYNVYSLIINYNSGILLKSLNALDYSPRKCVLEGIPKVKTLPMYHLQALLCHP